MDGDGDDDGRLVRVVPGTRGRPWGEIGVQADEAPLDDFTVAALERIVPLVALTLRQAHHAAALADRHRGDILLELLAGRLSGEEAAARARGLGFEATGRSLLPLVIAPARVDPVPGGATDRAGLWRTVHRQLQDAGTPAMLGSRTPESDVLMLLAVRSRDDRCQVVDRAVGTIHAALHRTAPCDGPPVIVAGATVDGWDDLPAELRRVADVSASVRHAPARRWHDAAKPDFAFVLWRLREDGAVLEFADRLLGPIDAHDRGHTHTLMPTLQALSASGWQLSRAAQALFLSRRSIYPRIARIEELLGCCLSDIDVRLGIDVALRTRAARDASVTPAVRAAR